MMVLTMQLTNKGLDTECLNTLGDMDDNGK